MVKWLGRGAFALVIVMIAAFVALATWEPLSADEATYSPESWTTYEAEIIRDEYGVPHIYGKTDADVAFGVAIAHAEDDFFTLQDVVAMSRGRYGAIAGQDGAQFDYVYHLLDARGTAERKYQDLPDDTRALFEAYASGLNQFAEDNPDEVKLGNLFPVNGEDVAAGFVLRQPFFFGLGNVIGPLVAGDPLPREFGPDIPGFPRDPAPADQRASDNQANLLHPLPMGEDAALLGSNAFAVTPERSGGPTTLISNSHQPLRGGVAWYEFSVESEEGWHFTGANFPGSPFPFLGHNEHLGWTNTVNRPDMADVYKLEVNEAGTQYRLDGEWRDLERKTVTLPVKMGPVTLPISREVLRSVHGPVIQNENGYFAIRYGGMDSVEQLDAYYRLNKTTNLEEWQEQIARMAIPSTNFIYADKEGNIAYVYNAAIPDRPEDVDANWRGVLDGSRSDLIWDGTVEYAEIPKLINPASGWIYNANNEPFTAAGDGSDLDPDAFSPVLGVERKQTNRSWRAFKLLSEADGPLDRAALERIKYDTGYERQGYIDRLWDEIEAMEMPIRMKDAGGRVARLKEARELLLDWDFTADNEGPADALAYLLIRDFMSAEYQNKPWPDVEQKVAEAADHLNTHFGRIDPPMSEVVRLRQGGVDLPLDGGSDTLRAATTWKFDEDGRASLVHGDSFIQWVEWPANGGRVLSRSIQPFGSAITRPDSPHATDQMQLFVDHKLKPVYFWRDDVEAAAKSRKTVTNAR
ncbi:acylase [Erythrobacter sp. YT30]|uniref:acylase n=1 Tax=Erythrobacter sp. YT30 TaxID=1735012 RepID=UPI00076C2431|nr:acylase [Erythrobacter sp. YT30]KWV90607.1 penicillin amidase [Erythrobacter sp. YT30]